jgi:hypothetical protein
MDKKETREAHKKAFLALLQRGEVITQQNHGKIFKCARVAARIFDIRADGHPIITTMIYNEKTGEKHAEYSYQGKIAPKKTEKALSGKAVVDYSRSILSNQTTLF